jgi:hypothetical protein
VTEPEVRLHDVSVTGDVDRAAVLAAIEQAIADASAAGPPTSDGVRSAVSAAISPVTASPVTAESDLAGTAPGVAHLRAPSWVRAPVHTMATGQQNHGDPQVR